MPCMGHRARGLSEGKRDWSGAHGSELYRIGTSDARSRARDAAPCSAARASAPCAPRWRLRPACRRCRPAASGAGSGVRPRRRARPLAPPRRAPGCPLATRLPRRRAPPAPAAAVGRMPYCLRRGPPPSPPSLPQQPRCPARRRLRRRSTRRCGASSTPISALTSLSAALSRSSRATSQPATSLSSWSSPRRYGGVVMRARRGRDTPGDTPRGRYARN